MYVLVCTRAYLLVCECVCWVGGGGWLRALVFLPCVLGEGGGGKEEAFSMYRKVLHAERRMSMWAIITS